jgi:hypothetical protein
MHERYVAHAEASGRPWLVAMGDHETRLAAVTAAIDALLAQA